MNAETHTSFILIERHASKVAPNLRSPRKKRPGLRKNLSDGVEELAEKAWRSDEQDGHRRRRHGHLSGRKWPAYLGDAGIWNLIKVNAGGCLSPIIALMSVAKLEWSDEGRKSKAVFTIDYVGRVNIALALRHAKLLVRNLANALERQVH